MSKFGKTMLKIIMVVSFLGIVVFVGIAVFNNQNIAYQAYNYIVSTKSKTDFDELSSNITSVKSTFGGSADPYANYMNDAILQLNSGISFFADYLVNENEISKGDQDSLCNFYADYILGLEATKNAYQKYIDSYEIAQTQVDESYENADYAIENVKTKCAFLVKEYVNFYQKGSKFFKFLVGVVNQYTFDTSNNFSYVAQSYMIKNGFVDFSLDFVVENMDKKLNDLTFASNIRTNINIDNFYYFFNNSGFFSDEQIVINTSFKNFVHNLNLLNIYSWAGDYDNYVATLNAEQSLAASSALSFFNASFKE